MTTLPLSDSSLYAYKPVVLTDIIPRCTLTRIKSHIQTSKSRQYCILQSCSASSDPMHTMLQCGRQRLRHRDERSRSLEMLFNAKSAAICGGIRHLQLELESVHWCSDQCKSAIRSLRPLASMFERNIGIHVSPLLIPWHSKAFGRG